MALPLTRVRRPGALARAPRTRRRGSPRLTGVTLMVGLLLGALPIHASPTIDTGQPAVVLIGSVPGSTALPAPPTADGFERVGQGLAAWRRAPADVYRDPPLEQSAVRAWSEPGTLHLPFGAGLLGLLAVPANAPPGA